MSRELIILVVDDSPPIRTFLRIALGSHGYEVLEAGTATEGEKLFNEKQPDLMILDLGLPDRDGLDLLADINKDGNANVVILTVRSEAEYKEKAYKLGAKAYMTKPFMTSEILEVIHSTLVESGGRQT